VVRTVIQEWTFTSYPPGGSTRMTSAPRSANLLPQYWPAIPDMSMTRKPVSALACVASYSRGASGRPVSIVDRTSALNHIYSSVIPLRSDRRRLPAHTSSAQTSRYRHVLGFAQTGRQFRYFYDRYDIRIQSHGASPAFPDSRQFCEQSERRSLRSAGPIIVFDSGEDRL
jgi:hypothetical protein